MSYVVHHGDMHQTTSPFATFSEALAHYAAHRNDSRDGARIVNENRSDGESDGLSEDERDQVDAIDHPRPAPTSQIIDLFDALKRSLAK